MAATRRPAPSADLAADRPASHVGQRRAQTKGPTFGQAAVGAAWQRRYGDADKARNTPFTRRQPGQTIPFGQFHGGAHRR